MPLKVIHWEIDEDASGRDDENKVQYALGYIRDGDTDSKKGFYIQWRVRLLDNAKWYNLIAEEAFYPPAIDPVSLNAGLLLSHRHLGEELKGRLDWVGLDLPNLNFPMLTQEKIDEFLAED